MARYSAAQIYAFAIEAGFDRGSATTMTAIALAESGGRGSAHATRGEDSRGLWQINAGAHPDLAARYDLFDPRQNALAAFAVSGHGHDISPWTTTHGGARAAYLRYRDAAQTAAVAHGEPAGLGVWSGTEGYGDHQDAGSAAGSADDGPADGADDGPAGGADDGPAGGADDGPAGGADDGPAGGADDGPAGGASDSLAPAAVTLDDNPFEVHTQALDGGALASNNPFEVPAQGLAGAALFSDNPFEAPPTAPIDLPAPAGLPAPGLSDHGLPAHGLSDHDVPTVAEPTIGTGTTESFVDAALAQTGDRYVFGAHAALNDPNPKAFDCAELVRWAGHRSGVNLPDGSWLQFLDLQRQGLVVPVQRGIDTRGALLFSFSTEPRPGAPRPSHAHVAISLGDGTTIEARGRAYGVGSFAANTTRFDYAALLPGTKGTAARGTTTSTAAHSGAAQQGTGDDTGHDSGPGAGHGLSLADLDAGYGAAQPVSLDTDTSDSGSAHSGLAYADDVHGLSSLAPADHGVVLGADPFTVDSDPDQLSDSLELLFGDAGAALDGLAAAPTPDPLDDAVHAALDTVAITPFDGFDGPPDQASDQATHAITTDAGHDAATFGAGQDPASPDADQHASDQHIPLDQHITLEQHGLDQHALDQGVSHSLDAFATDPGHDAGSATVTDTGHA